MNIQLLQADRAGILHTDLGKDELVLMRFRGAEHVNSLFEFEVDALSLNDNADFNALVGTHASLEFDVQGTGNKRFFDGIVTQARWLGPAEGGFRYRMSLRSWFSLLDQRRDQRIFHKMTVVQILEEVFAPYLGLGDPAVKFDVVQSYRELEYTVQYRESDMDFAMRQMERFGISYHFEHKRGSHCLVLTDAVDSHAKIEGGTRDFWQVDGQNRPPGEHFWQWEPERNMTVGAIRLTDYNFKKPRAAMEADQLGDAQYAQGQMESYDYPGDYLEQGIGKGVAALRVIQERGHDIRHRAVGDCISLGAGMRLGLTGDPLSAVSDKDFICLSATHNYTSNAFATGDTGNDNYSYTGDYTLMPETAPLAPERKTHIPVVEGPQTAAVVGDGEIDCDEYGRILVHFHWDLLKRHSMRCRVSQNWAHKGWGGMVIPRIGMEVVVEFLEGDPDKPLVTGCVYNGQNDPPYTLPAYKARSTFKTDTHRGTGYNELRFEDESDEEEVYLQAEKYLNAYIKDNETWLTQGSRHRRVDGSQSQSVGGDKDMEVQGDHREHIKGSQHMQLDGSRVDAIKICDYLKVTGDRVIEVERNADTYVDKDMRTETGGKQYNKVGTTQFVDAGTDIVLTAGSTISFNVGGNFVKIDGSGVTINGTLTRINSGGSAKKGKKIDRMKPLKPKKYAGPHATRYARSFKK
ncbi:type VI secretion system Vgr family protein [Litoreibacter janthinus]|uniref:Type VI secretion system secreted protein VgrG n=1 Tax=Litoreibacter janthinus TaxID=670154 RepID=A0A1I6HDB9_9RHOB|nr:type VI secretion system tip protein TssI/VgrG [Litoreibacter janthinus]SFR52358.1 type VI secretion system secreted protein VgrG [Litoreibacter janthinus]